MLPAAPARPFPASTVPTGSTRCKSRWRSLPLPTALSLSLEGQITQQMADAGVGELEQIFMVEQAAWYDHVVVNDDVQRCAQEILSIID